MANLKSQLYTCLPIACPLVTLLPRHLSACPSLYIYLNLPPYLTIPYPAVCSSCHLPVSHPPICLSLALFPLPPCLFPFSQFNHVICCLLSACLLIYPLHISCYLSAFPIPHVCLPPSYLVTCLPYSYQFVCLFHSYPVTFLLASPPVCLPPSCLVTCSPYSYQSVCLFHSYPVTFLLSSPPVCLPPSYLVTCLSNSYQSVCLYHYSSVTFLLSRTCLMSPFCLVTCLSYLYPSDCLFHSSPVTFLPFSPSACLNPTSLSACLSSINLSTCSPPLSPFYILLPYPASAILPPSSRIHQPCPAMQEPPQPPSLSVYGSALRAKVAPSLSFTFPPIQSNHRHFTAGWPTCRHCLRS